MAEEEPKPLSYIPETILKKRKNSEAWTLRKKEQFEQNKFQSSNSKGFIRNPEDFILEYRNRELDLVRMKRRVKRKPPALLTPESNLLIIIRIQGYPNLKSIKELIYKKGNAKIDKQRVPLTDNNIVQQELGQFGIVCIEDMVHQISSVGPHFKEVASFLWPFELNKPAEGLQGSKSLYKDGGDREP